MDNENFAVQLADSATTHDEWLAIVKFGLGTLLKDQPLLIELVVREAARECERGKSDTHVPADYARVIFQELKLKLAVAG